jgi:hypothetical protein
MRIEAPAHHLHDQKEAQQTRLDEPRPPPGNERGEYQGAECPNVPAPTALNYPALGPQSYALLDRAAENHVRQRAIGYKPISKSPARGCRCSVKIEDVADFDPGFCCRPARTNGCHNVVEWNGRRVGVPTHSSEPRVRLKRRERPKEKPNCADC